MKEREDKKNEELKQHVMNAIEHLCSTETDIIHKILENVRQSKAASVEPGVEMVDSLAKIIRDLLVEAKNQGCDPSIIIKGIIIGAFRASDSVRMEAHKTIDHLVRQIVSEILSLTIDLDSIKALIEGVIVIAKEQKLNVPEAVSEAGTSIILAVRSVKKDLENQTRQLLSQPINGVIIELKEDFLQRQRHLSS